MKRGASLLVVLCLGCQTNDNGDPCSEPSVSPETFSLTDRDMAGASVTDGLLIGHTYDLHFTAVDSTCGVQVDLNKYLHDAKLICEDSTGTRCTVLSGSANPDGSFSGSFRGNNPGFVTLFVVDGSGAPNGFNFGDRFFADCNPLTRSNCPTGMACGIQFYSQMEGAPIGMCEDACDVFAQGCSPDPSGAARGCYAAGYFGEGVCRPSRGGAAEQYCGGGPVCAPASLCGNDCAAGLDCGMTASGQRCVPYCGGPNSVACTDGHSCAKMSSSFGSTVAGLCTGL